MFKDLPLCLLDQVVNPDWIQDWDSDSYSAQLFRVQTSDYNSPDHRKHEIK